MKKKKSSTPEASATSIPAETPESKLIRLSSARVSAAIHRIELCGNLANYKPTPEQATKIVEALKGTVKSVEARLMNTAQRSGAVRFTL